MSTRLWCDRRVINRWIEVDFRIVDLSFLWMAMWVRDKVFSVRRVADTTLGKFRDDGLYFSVLPIGEIIC